MICRRHSPRSFQLLDRLGVMAALAEENDYSRQRLDAWELRTKLTVACTGPGNKHGDTRKPANTEKTFVVA